jgi:antirestriction protein ArdC
MTWEEKIEYHKQRSDDIASHIITQIEEGVDSWEMPWHRGLPLAKNRVTGKFYGGKNLLILWDECLNKSYSQNVWATMRQWNRIKSGVKKGSKGTLIKFVIPNEEFEDLDQLEFEFGDDESEQNNGFRIFFNYVYNIDQVTNNHTGQVGIFDDRRSEAEIIDDFISRTRAKIVHTGERAFYRVAEDKITMPPKAAFKDTNEAKSIEHYYSTLLHEIIHWTGHETRCDRSLINTFGSSTYAFEELVAELGTAILTTQFNNRLVPRRGHAKYVNHWLGVLKYDFNFFIEALELARTAVYWLYEKTEVLPHPLNNNFPREASENLVKELESHLETDKSDESLSEVINKWDQIKESTKLKIIKMISREFGNKHPEE